MRKTRKVTISEKSVMPEVISRSFYVGEYLTEEDIHPKYENGILSFVVPKEEEKPVEEKSHYITIE